MAAAGFTYNQKKKTTSYCQLFITNPAIGSKNLPAPTSKTNATRTVHSNGRPPTFPGPQKVVEVKVPLCCQGCEENVRSELLTSLDGVNEISVDMETQKVIVKGEIQASTVLTTVKRVKNRAEFWKN